MTKTVATHNGHIDKGECKKQPTRPASRKAGFAPSKPPLTRSAGLADWYLSHRPLSVSFPSTGCRIAMCQPHATGKTHSRPRETRGALSSEGAYKWKRVLHVASWPASSRGTVQPDGLLPDNYLNNLSIVGVPPNGRDGHDGQWRSSANHGRGWGIPEGPGPWTSGPFVSSRGERGGGTGKVCGRSRVARGGLSEGEGPQPWPMPSEVEVPPFSLAGQIVAQTNGNGRWL